MTHRELVESLWHAFDRFEFAAVADLLHDDFVCEWLQSRERIRGRDNFIAINTHYPGQWRINIVRLVDSGDELVTEIVVTDGQKTDRAVSFFQFKDNKIYRIREYWLEPYAAPDWRQQWVEPMAEESWTE